MSLRHGECEASLDYIHLVSEKRKKQGRGEKRDFWLIVLRANHFSMHDFKMCLRHLENIDSWSYADLPNVHTF